LIQSPDNLLDRVLEIRKCASDVPRGDAVAIIDTDLDFLQTQFSTECTNVSRIGNVEVTNGLRLPVTRRFNRRSFTPARGIPYFFQDLP